MKHPLIIATLIGAGVMALAALIAVAVSEKPKVVSYVISTDKVTKPIRLLHISDLHSSPYGDQLISLTEDLAPDAILMTGDIADNRVPNDHAFAYTKAVGERYPCFFVTGNHEFYSGHVATLRQTFSSHGLTLLSGEAATLVIGENTIIIGGVDDPFGLPYPANRLWDDQLASCQNAVSKDHFSILLTHRPERVDSYRETDFDLILAGHAHGGQVILPGLVNGLFAPNQGFFPEYAGGRYSLKEGQTMIVSRGLSKYVKPRVFNRPELVLITLLPSDT